ncbi:hypothetical protein [Allokutzneria oryzae]|uniref:DUF4178 domain-containing protein n=1 Tax=Allokutzneria oryzae TaxID=1378989 RepID=A0ABV5ZXF3_9PSEU
MIVLVVIVLLVAWLATRRQARRDALMNSRWQAMCARQMAEPGLHVVRMASVYQRARRGSKAVIVWGTGYQQDTWFAGNWPVPGSILMIRGTVGWGPHNNNPNVFYVEPDQVICALPPGTERAVARHQERQARSITR